MLSPILHLMRLHQPTGIWLLLWPCWWSLALAWGGFPPLEMLFLFALGAVLMRAAGCIVNDIADRDVDKMVERTRSRPLASGEISVPQAILLLALLLFLSLLVALALGRIVVMWAALALLPIAIYPWMKRISWWPQLFLGLVFNWGAFMGWAAVRGAVEWPAIVLYAGCIFWTLGYDTIYAHQDKADDAKIGVKSSALALGRRTKPVVAAFYALALAGWAGAAALAGSSPWSYGFLLAAGIHLAWQVKSVNIDGPSSCRAIFTSNTILGWLIFGGFILNHI